MAGSLTLDMLRRNGRRKAPRSAPHRTVHDGRSSVNNDGVTSDEEEYRRQSIDLSSKTFKAQSNRGSNGGNGGIDNNTDEQLQQQQQQQLAAEDGDESQRTRSNEKDMERSNRTETQINIRTAVTGNQELCNTTTEGENNIDRSAKPSTAAAGAAPSRGGNSGIVSATGSNSNRPSSAPYTESPGVSIGSLSHSREATAGVGNGSEGGGAILRPPGLVLEYIELVNLHNLSLHKLEGMERLVCLRVANLSGNELHDTWPLRSCACLEVRLFPAVNTQKQ